MSASKSNVQNKEINKEINSEMSFVSRWSRLKHVNKQTNDAAAVDAVIDAVDDSIVDTTAKQTIASDEEQQAPVKILTDAEMPDIKSMTADSDYTDFLSPGVSEELRRLALRKLFRSEVFNIRDGLDDYDSDYTHFEKLGDIETSDMKHHLELEAKRKAEQALQNDDCVTEINADERADDRAGEDGISEMHIDSDSDDSADKNNIAANQQGMSQSSHDDAQTVAASAEKNTKEPDENVGFADTTINKADQNKD
jgi:hypothetical protein